MRMLDKKPELLQEWDFEKNTDTDPYLIDQLSLKKVWWKGKCGHSFLMRVDTRTQLGKGCYYCYKKRNIPKLDSTHPHIAEQWHPTKNGDLKPSDVTSGEHRKVWWLRPQCGHEWEVSLCNRTSPRKKNRIGCPYCANKRHDGENSLAFCYPNVASDWHPTKNGSLSPDKINCAAYKKVWWLGKKCGHEWKSLVHSRTRKRRPSGCPHCQNSSGEREVERFLKENGVLYEKQKTFRDCRDKYPLRFDFYLLNLNVLIEYQGIQHYQPTDFGGDYKKTFEIVQRHDKIKNEWAKENGYDLLLISYVDYENVANITFEFLKGKEVKNAAPYLRGSQDVPRCCERNNEQRIEKIYQDGENIA